MLLPVRVQPKRALRKIKMDRRYIVSICNALNSSNQTRQLPKDLNLLSVTLVERNGRNANQDTLVLRLQRYYEVRWPHLSVGWLQLLVLFIQRLT